MRRLLAAFAMITLGASASCATEGGLRARAAETLGCPEGSVSIVSNEGGRATVAACGMHATYAADVDLRGREGSPHNWKLLGWSFDRYGRD